MINSKKLTQEDVIDADPEVDAVLETEVHKGACCMVLYEPRILGAMIGVVPLIRGQQQLTEHVGQTLVNESPVVLWFQSECRNDLEHQHQQLLWRNSETLERVLGLFTFLTK
jgi:hypothetical protein